MSVQRGLWATAATGLVAGGSLLAAILGPPPSPVPGAGTALLLAVDPRLQAALALAWWLPAAALHVRRPLLPFWRLALPAASATRPRASR